MLRGNEKKEKKRSTMHALNSPVSGSGSHVSNACRFYLPYQARKITVPSVNMISKTIICVAGFFCYRV